MTETPPLVEVHILGVPLDTYRETSEHTDELLREFTLIRESDTSDTAQVPSRLLALVDELTSRFSGFTTQQEAELSAALERGDTTIDLVYRVPAAVKEACFDLERMLDEADEFCRSGDALLTMASPPHTVAFRRWFLGEFVRQVDGHAPTPWREFAALP